MTKPDRLGGSTPGRSPKMILAASTGGHLAQLVRIGERFEPSDDSLWISFDSAQSRSLLAGRRTLFVPYIAPRDWRGMLVAHRLIARHIRGESFDLSISTGAGLAVSALSAARRRRIPAKYIESISRTDGPSVSGRIVRTLRIADTYTQHPNWAGRGWKTAEPVLADYQSVPSLRAVDGQPKVFVTLGTIQPFRFDRLVDRLVSQNLVNEDTVWQVGCTSRTDLPGRTFDYISQADFRRYSAEADVVVTHAGVGTIMDLLDRGVTPVVVPRRRSENEHVDDHQMQIVELLRDRGVAVPADVDQLASHHYATAVATLSRRADD